MINTNIVRFSFSFWCFAYTNEIAQGVRLGWTTCVGSRHLYFISRFPLFTVTAQKAVLNSNVMNSVCWTQPSEVLVSLASLAGTSCYHLAHGRKYTVRPGRVSTHQIIWHISKHNSTPTHTHDQKVNRKEIGNWSLLPITVSAFLFLSTELPKYVHIELGIHRNSKDNARKIQPEGYLRQSQHKTIFFQLFFMLCNTYSFISQILHIFGCQVQVPYLLSHSCVGYALITAFASQNFCSLHVYLVVCGRPCKYCMYLLFNSWSHIQSFSCIWYALNKYSCLPQILQTACISGCLWQALQILHIFAFQFLVPYPVFQLHMVCIK